MPHKYAPYRPQWCRHPDFRGSLDYCWGLANAVDDDKLEEFLANKCDDCEFSKFYKEKSDG